MPFTRGIAAAACAFTLLAGREATTQAPQTDLAIEIDRGTKILLDFVNRNLLQSIFFAAFPSIDFVGRSCIMWRSSTALPRATFASSLLLVILLPSVAVAGWGDESWGEMIWGVAPRLIPALPPAGLALLALLFALVPLARMTRRRRRERERG